MNNIQLAAGVYYVGAVDWNTRDFHGFGTPRGVTYNSYLIVDEKICLIDTVKAPFADELLERISQIIDPAKIDYIVVNHVEPDHSSALPIVMQKATNAKVILTEAGKAETLKHYHTNYDFQVVKEGDSLDLGKHKLHFIPLPMLHWPDSMASYLDGEEILFSNDAFGQHICTTKRFDDENDLHDIMYEAAKYYANILMPFGKLVGKALTKTSQIPIKMIAPSHGIVWRSHIADVLHKYEQWGTNYTTDKVVIVYDTMWGSTEKMARRILEGIAATGVEAKLYKVSITDRSELLKEILEAKAVLIGSSTQNNGPLATVGGLMTYLKGLRPANKFGASFGAYGWGGGAQKVIDEGLASAGIAVEASLSLKWVPDREELDKCFEYGVEFGKKVLAAKK